MAHAVQHYLKRKRSGKLSSFGFSAILDKVIYISAFTGPIMILPQVLKIWQGREVSGVSGIYWSGIFMGSVLWGVYGFVHKERPIVIANLLTLFLSGAIIIGVILYNTEFK